MKKKKSYRLGAFLQVEKMDIYCTAHINQRVKVCSEDWQAAVFLTHYACTFPVLLQ